MANTTPNKPIKTGSHRGKKVAAGVAALAAAGAAAGAYYFYGSKKGKERRAKAAAWVSKARAEVMREARKLQETALNEQQYKKIVKAVGEKYRKMKGLDSQDVVDFVRGAGAEWASFREKGTKTTTPKTIIRKKKVSVKTTKHAG